MRTVSFDLSTVRDVQDAQEASNQHFATLAQQAREGKPLVGMQSRYQRPRTGQRDPATGKPMPSHGSRTRGDCTDYNHCAPGRHGREDCDTVQPCGADVLGWHSLGQATFPLAGIAAPGVNTNATPLAVNSGNANKFRPRKIFFEARDQAANFTVVPSLLTSAVISGKEQLVGGTAAFGITSSVFALTNEPLPVGWDDFSDRGQQVLSLTFGNFLGAAVTTQYFGVFWGDRI